MVWCSCWDHSSIPVLCTGNLIRFPRWRTKSRIKRIFAQKSGADWPNSKKLAQLRKLSILKRPCMALNKYAGCAQGLLLKSVAVIGPGQCLVVCSVLRKKRLHLNTCGQNAWHSCACYICSTDRKTNAIGNGLSDITSSNTDGKSKGAGKPIV